MISMILVICMEFHELPHWFCKGVSYAFSHIEKPRFCIGFSLFSKFENSSKSAWELPSDLDAFWVFVTTFHKCCIGFVKGFRRRFRISENLDFANDFLSFPRSENRSESDWVFPSGFDVLVICMECHKFIKGLQMRFRKSENLGFAMGFLCFQSAKTALHPTGNSQARLLLCG